MAFDDGINTLLDNGNASTIAGCYLAKLVTSGTTTLWENAALSSGTIGSLAVSGGSTIVLADFLNNEYNANPTIPHDTLLAELAGSWGVGFDSRRDVCLRGRLSTAAAASFAVVPEPSTCVLLGAGVAGLLVDRVRRKARRKSPGARALPKTVTRRKSRSQPQYERTFAGPPKGKGQGTSRFPALFLLLTCFRLRTALRPPDASPGPRSATRCR